MVSLVTRAILYSIFGFFIYETINEFKKLFALSVNPYLAVFPALLVYVFQEYAIKKLTANKRAPPLNKRVEARTDRVCYLFVWILMVSFFFGILVVWAGVVFKNTVTNI